MLVFNLSISVQFSKTICLSHSSDSFILSLTETFVNKFFCFFLLLNICLLLRDEIYLIISSNKNTYCFFYLSKLSSIFYNFFYFSLFFVSWYTRHRVYIIYTNTCYFNNLVLTITTCIAGGFMFHFVQNTKVQTKWLTPRSLAQQVTLSAMQKVLKAK